MNNFGVVPKLIARALSRFPRVKALGKALYQRWVYIFNKPTTNEDSLYPVKKVGVAGCETFFGYYDKTPISQSGYVLAHLSERSTQLPPSAEQGIYVGVFEAGKNIEPIMMVETHAYNWQQGARAQWLTNDHFIVNDYSEEANAYISKRYSVEGNELIKTYEFPVQDAFCDSYFLSVNYRRLMALRPDYGYRNLPALSESELKDLWSDGIWYVEMESGDSKLLLSLEAIVNHEFENKFSAALHKVNHVMISPCGEKFLFLHRYYMDDKRSDRLLVSDLSGNITTLSSKGMVSHCCWKGEDEIIGYLRGDNEKDAYWCLNVKTAEMTKQDVGVVDQYGDGHPHSTGSFFVTDTYPDKARMQHLFKVGVSNGEVEELGSFFHGFAFKGETRCDLHPRLSPDGTFVFFDSVSSGRRQLCYMEIE
ncbi:glycosyl transferase [Halomonas sp. SL1]|uniref:glycosyl transferase n=1 Tax=Halomonas sp. SL1 TaxID=2137478 RepID=UPI0011B9481F|nr:glycosyl transferase [Halomonas sp. SL1]